MSNQLTSLRKFIKKTQETICLIIIGRQMDPCDILQLETNDIILIRLQSWTLTRAVLANIRSSKQVRTTNEENNFIEAWEAISTIINTWWQIEKDLQIFFSCPLIIFCAGNVKIWSFR